MATIANLNVMLTASIGGFSSTIRGAGSSLQSLGSEVANIGSKIFSLSGAITGIAAGGGILLLVKNSMEAMAATGRLSDRMGIATEKLGGLQYAAKLAGLDNEELTNGLEKMLHSLGEAATGSGTAAGAFAHLGLDAAKLASMSPDKAFTAIAEGLKNIQNPAERAAVAMEIFGKSGQNLLPLMMQGKEGLAAAQAEAVRLGVALGGVDHAKVELAAQSMRRMQAVIEGATQALTVQLAPFIDVVANKLANLGSSGQGAGGFVTVAFNAVLSTLADLADFLSIVQSGWNLLRSGASYAIGGMIDGLSYVLDGLDWLLKKLGQAATGWGTTGHQLSKAFYETGNDAFQQAGENFDAFMNADNSKKAARFMADIQDRSTTAAKAIADNAAKMNGAAASTEDWSKKLQTAAENAKKVTETLAELKKELATAGMSESQKKLFDLKQLGATPEQLAQAQKLSDALDKIAASKKAMEEGQKVFDETRSPMEKYETQLGKLSDLLDSGSIDWTTYGRAIRKAREELEKTNETKAPNLFQGGTAEAQRYAYEQKNARAFDATRGVQKQNVNKDELGTRQFNEQYQSRLILQRIENKLTDANNDPTETVEIA